ncbi:hypothetical protein [Salinibacter altiplanensis]|uniref:hypothetical protein n=1 Tax=Salinibacter altiplanensis TaxID=1803181 RepID=UPI000C9FCF92|nr:hypothetical protein [Salinibacter altiplanensis]
MAQVARNSPDLDLKSARKAPQLSGLKAGADLETGMPVRVDSNGEVVPSNASADDANAQMDGIAARPATAGEPITVYGPGVRLQYNRSGSLTPGSTLFVAAADGELDDTSTTGDSTGVARAISETDIVILRPNV